MGDARRYLCSQEQAIYKIISKTLANRIKGHLPNFISKAQSAFVPNRHISSNIIIVQEIIHSFNLNSWKDHSFILKLDLAKAFDRLEWNFILAALRKIGFNNHFINLVHACISSPPFAVLANGLPSDSFAPQRGLRQGCPLPPYLLDFNRPSKITTSMVFLWGPTRLDCTPYYLQTTSSFVEKRMFERLR